MDTSTTKFDLTLGMSSHSVVVEGKEQLFVYGSLEYNRDIFDGSTMERMMENFTHYWSRLLWCTKKRDKQQ